MHGALCKSLATMHSNIIGARSKGYRAKAKFNVLTIHAKRSRVELHFLQLFAHAGSERIIEEFVDRCHAH